MTFEEMRRKHDLYCGFSGFHTMAMAKASGFIPKELAEDFPNTCECGSDMIISFENTQPQCCDPKCRIRQGYCLAEMFQRFGYKGLGPQKCCRIVNDCWNKLERGSYVEILFLTHEQMPMSLAGSDVEGDLLCARCAILSTPMTFATMVAKLGLPALDRAVCDKLFSNINSVEELVTEFTKCKSEFTFCANRGVMDKRVVYWLHNSLVHIAFADQYFRRAFRKQGLTKLDVCITGSIFLNGSRITKENFLQLCNNASITSTGVQLLEITKNEAVKTNPYIIASSPSTNSKYLTAVNREKSAQILRDQGYDVPKILLTPEEFLQKIKDMTQVWEAALEESEKAKAEGSDDKVKIIKADLF